MNTAPLKISAAIIILSGVAGALRFLLLSLQHEVNAEWAVLTSYLLAIPLMQLTSLLPGLITGYIFGGKQIILAFIVGMISYMPFQAASSFSLSLSLSLSLDAPTLVAHGSAFALVTVISFLAGAYISQASNKRFKPFASLSGTAYRGPLT